MWSMGFAAGLTMTDLGFFVSAERFPERFPIIAQLDQSLRFPHEQYPGAQFGVHVSQI